MQKFKIITQSAITDFYSIQRQSMDRSQRDKKTDQNYNFLHKMFTILAIQRLFAL